MRRRNRGEGSVFYSTRDGAWIARVSLGVVDGKRVGKKVTIAGARTDTRAKRAAEAELDRLQRAYRLGDDPATGTLDEYLRDWLEANRRVRASTLRSYREHVELHISPLLGGIPVARLRAADVERLVADRLAHVGKHGRPLSPATVGHIVSTLRIALNRGVKRGELQRNVAGLVDLPRSEPAPIAPMTEAEAQRLVDAFSGHWLGPLVRLLSGSALRLGEALSLNQEDIGEGFIRIRKSKTTIRAVPITEDAEQAIREAMTVAPRRGPKEPLFFGPRPNRQGHRDRLGGSTVSHAVPRVIEAAGLARLTPHGLRHGAATLMVAKGAHMRVVAEQLGHKNPALTARIYAHVIPSQQRDAVRLLERERH